MVTQGHLAKFAVISLTMNVALWFSPASVEETDAGGLACKDKNQKISFANNLDLNGSLRALGPHCKKRQPMTPRSAEILTPHVLHPDSVQRCAGRNSVGTTQFDNHANEAASTSFDEGKTEICRRTVGDGIFNIHHLAIAASVERTHTPPSYSEYNEKDQPAPFIVTDLSGTAVSPSAIKLAWTPSGGRYRVAYDVFRNDARIGTTTHTSLVDGGLKGNTTYRYRVSARGAKGTKPGMSPSISVTTFAQKIPITFIGTGDIAYDGPGDEDTARLIDEAVAADPDAIVFTLGDNAYPEGSASNFSDFYEPTWGRHKSRTHPVPGNHDYRTTNAQAYFDFFGAAAGERGKGYYSYDVAGWHIIALNSEIDMDSRSQQELWLRKDLQGSRSACVLAYWHQPLFSSGNGATAGVRPLWQALYEFGADVVLNGHDHLYERFAPQTPGGETDRIHGIREFVVGTGGVSLYSFQKPLPTSEIRNNTHYGVL